MSFARLKALSNKSADIKIAWLNRNLRRAIPFSPITLNNCEFKSARAVSSNPLQKRTRWLTIA